MNSTKNKLILYSLILGFLGFIVATYLTILHYKNIVPPCSVIANCEKVLTSQYATIGPISVALLGSVFYLLVMVICTLLLTNYKKIYLNAFYLLSITGFMVSVALIVIQAFILHAFCQYCLTSEAISTGILILAYLNFRKEKQVK